MSYFRAVLHKQEYSLRAFQLTGEVISVCTGFYTAWHYRGILLDQLQLDLNQEIEFLSKMSTKNPKNYQIWSYRREILKKINKPDGEIDFLNSILEIDAKNIHAWGYRQWVISKFNLWDQENIYTINLIKNDPLNNSAWSQKYFIISNNPDFHSPSKKLEEIDFALYYCDDINNECPYNYLRPFYTLDQSEYIKDKIGDIIERKGYSRQLLQFLAFVYSYEKNGEILELIYGLLENTDYIRKVYWGWKKSNTKINVDSRSIQDVRICRLIGRVDSYNPMSYYYRLSRNKTN
jgi:protein farnesyltransferase/geranylgeranyltransferase type-1 subunit alpha